MSHADDGTLHAYLDGELSALEAVRLEAHLSECADCRKRLTEERGLVTRAGELLAAAVPPERAQPPLHRLGHPRPGRRVRFPLAWAATIVLAVAVVWFVRPSGAPQGLDQDAFAERPLTVTPPRVDSAPRAAPVDLARTSEETAAPSRGEAAPPAGAAAPAAPPAQEQQRAQAPAPPAPPIPTPSEPAGLAARDAAGDLAAARAYTPPGAKAALPDGAARENAAVAARSMAPPAVRSRAPDLGAGAQLYPGTISATDARALLGADPVAVPGLRVVSIRRARLAGYSPVVVVEQALDSSSTIAVVHRRPAVPVPMAGLREGAAAAPTERRADTTALADSVAGVQGRLEIEVVGALPPDSLSRLRAALQPLIRR